MLSIYGLERFLYRVSISPYASNYVLKGGMLLYAMFEGDFMRGTVDVDFLGCTNTNNIEDIKKTFNDIFSIPYSDDCIVYDLESLKITRITEFKKYPGISISIDSYLDKTKIRVQVDVGFGDIVYPKPLLMDYPTLLDQPAPSIHVYAKETIVAEKFEAIVSFGNANSRMKDFFDIYVLLNTHDFESLVLAEAIMTTFSNRKTSFSSIKAFDEPFFEDANRLRMWSSFQKSKQVNKFVDLKEVITQIKAFLLPVVDSMNQSRTKGMTWDHNDKRWIVS